MVVSPYFPPKSSKHCFPSKAHDYTCTAAMRSPKAYSEGRFASSESPCFSFHRSWQIDSLAGVLPELSRLVVVKGIPLAPLRVPAADRTPPRERVKGRRLWQAVEIGTK
jgi:hypothetical protein